MLVPSARVNLSWIASAALLCGVLVGCANRPPAPDAAVTGAALARERIRLAPDVVFEATLLDVTNPDLPPVVLGRQRRESAGNPPYAVWIPYPSVRFAPKGQYEVRAAVTLEGRVLFATEKRYAVPQDAAFRRVNVWRAGKAATRHGGCERAFAVDALEASGHWWRSCATPRRRYRGALSGFSTRGGWAAASDRIGRVQPLLCGLRGAGFATDGERPDEQHHTVLKTSRQRNAVF